MTLEPDAITPVRFLSAPVLTRVGAPHAFLSRHVCAEALEPRLQGEEIADDGRAHGVAIAAGIDPQRVYTAQQVHGATVIVLNGDPDRSRVRRREADALVTAVPGQSVAVRTADCVPVLLFDPVRNVCAAIHAGWRGIVGGVLQATVRELTRKHGSRTADLVAAVGPAIGPCHFEVSDEVAARFGAIEGAVRPAATGSGPHVDLPLAVKSTLQRQGINEVDSTPNCTYCDPGLYHSFRRDGSEAGRMLSIIGTRRPLGA